MKTAPLLLLAASSCLLVRTDAQSAQCQESYNAFDSEHADCRAALNYATNGNVLAPLRLNLSDSNLDTLCSGPGGSDCRATFLSYFRHCITEAPGLGADPEFFEGDLDTSRLTNLENAVCRKDCVVAERYCYATVRRALLNTVCDDVTTTCSTACQQALDQTGCCGQNVFRTKNSNVGSVCCLWDFHGTCQELGVDCSADLPGTSCSLITSTSSLSVPPPSTSAPSTSTSVPTQASPTPVPTQASPTPVPSPSPSSPLSPTSTPPYETASPAGKDGNAHLHHVATSLAMVPALLISCLMAAAVL